MPDQGTKHLPACGSHGLVDEHWTLHGVSLFAIAPRESRV